MVWAVLGVVVVWAITAACNALARAFTAPEKRMMYGRYRPVLERVEPFLLFLVFCAIGAWLTRP